MLKFMHPDVVAKSKGMGHLCALDTSSSFFIAPACSRVRYRRPIFCPSVRPSVRQSVRQSVRPSVNIYVDV